MQRELDEKRPALESAQTSLHVMSQMLESEQARARTLLSSRGEMAARAEEQLAGLREREEALCRRESQALAQSEELRELLRVAHEAISKSPDVRERTSEKLAAEAGEKLREEHARQGEKLAAAQAELAMRRHELKQSEQWADAVTTAWFPAFARRVNRALEERGSTFRVDPIMANNGMEQ